METIFADFGVRMSDYDLGALDDLEQEYLIGGNAPVLWFLTQGETNWKDSYCGEYTSEQEFAWDRLDICYDLPQGLMGYIDIESFTRDLMMDHIAIEYGGLVYIFENF